MRIYVGMMLFCCVSLSGMEPGFVISVGTITVEEELTLRGDLVDVKNARAKTLTLVSHTACCDCFDIEDEAHMRAGAALTILNSQFRGVTYLQALHTIINNSTIREICVTPTPAFLVQLISLKNTVIEGNLSFLTVSQDHTLKVILDKDSKIKGEVKGAQILQGAL